MRGERLKQLIDILWYKLAVWKVFSVPRFGSAPVKNILTFLVYTAFAAGAVGFARFVTWYLLDYIHIGLFLFHRFVAMMLFVFFITVSVGNIVVSFATLYRSPEMSFLLSAPIPFSTIFTVKFLDNFFYSSGTLFLASAAMLIGYGSHFHLDWYFYPFFLFGVLMPCMLIAGSSAVIVLLFVMKLASKIGFKVLIGCVAAVYVLQAVFYFTITSPVSLVREVMQYYPHVNVYYGGIDPFAARFLPNYWAAQVLYFWVTGFTSGAVVNAALCVLTSMALFVTAVLLGGRMFYATWLTSISLRTTQAGKAAARPPFFHFERVSRLPSQMEAVLKKEYWTFFREPSQWVHASVLGGLLIIFLVSVSTMEFKVVTADLRAVIFLVVFMFNAFLISSIALRFAYPLMSLEGRAYWTIRSAPIRPRKVYWIKFGSMAMFLATLGFVIWTGSIAPYRRMPFIPESSLVIIMSVAAAAASLNFGMGSLYADYAERNPIRIASSQGATMTFLFTMLLLAVIVAMYFYPVVAVFVAQSAKSAIDPLPLKNAAAVSVGLSALVALVSHAAGVRALERDL